MTENVTTEKEEKRELLAVLIDVYNDEVQSLVIEDNLDTYYKLLDCKCIDIVTRTIGKKRFDIVCDGEGCFRQSQKISAINNLGLPMLVGNLIILGLADSEGRCTSLSEEDVTYIMERVFRLGTKNFPEGYFTLTQCEG